MRTCHYKRGVLISDAAAHEIHQQQCLQNTPCETVLAMSIKRARALMITSVLDSQDLSIPTLSEHGHPRVLHPMRRTLDRHACSREDWPNDRAHRAKLRHCRLQTGVLISDAAPSQVPELLAALPTHVHK
jgi:hypothetical protein